MKNLISLLLQNNLLGVEIKLIECKKPTPTRLPIPLKKLYNKNTRNNHGLLDRH